MPSSTTARPYAEIKIYTRSSSGRFARLRWLMVWLTQLVFYATPWLLWNGRQAVLFDLDARRFYLFNLVLYPQDFIYLTLLLIISALGLFFVTTLAGRIWCGFACPQTVYTKLFMWLEQQFEGDRSARMRLDASPWSLAKLARKAGTQVSWITLSLWTGFTFVAYFTPARTLAIEALQAGWGPWETFWVGFYGLATYGNAGYLREQVCKHMCPYARFQSAMFDRDTLIIGYDSRRGEPRGSRARGTEAQAKGLGDCINCTMCVQVCPTGIDIRDGLQSNCIGCAACIDACDDVMDKIGAPRGLVRYATQNAMDSNRTGLPWVHHLRRPRVLVYGGLLQALVLGLVAGLAVHNPLRVNVIRDRGVMARMVEQGAIENVYRLQVMHALEHAQRYRISVSSDQVDGLGTVGPAELELASTEERTLPIAVRLPAAQAEALAGQSIAIQFHIRPVGDADVATEVSERSRFLVPR
ncbi:cytochrome c oxidase accessory protein CcoG [Rhodoferax sp. GW822-FHT02A01]|uniref:cytochrome c oxidase accessory protein CcoG n=1 Tax=Rhodoferax sp. GW822-FHT02A01 TaxID=3141537 RepID=UPI00315CC07C